MSGRSQRRGPLPGVAGKLQPKKKKRRGLVTEKPPSSQFLNALNLPQLAYVLGKALRTQFTVYQIAGCISALKLKANDTRNTIEMRGVVVMRQKTFVLVSMLPPMQKYLKERHGL